jgi:alkylation response protein AidB-like acyl-CoA dehydrogenase
MPPSLVKRSSKPELNHLLQTAIAPQAELLDRDPQALKQAFELLGSHHLLGLSVPTEWGGKALNSREFNQFIEHLSCYSGALALLQIQHQSAVKSLAASENLALKQRYLEAAAKGHIGIGIGYSHLRRPQQPVTVEETPEGYRFNGVAPWVTGFGIFQYWLLAGQLPDGRAVFALVPFRAVTEAGQSLSFGPPMELAAMGSTQTVAAKLTNWLVSQDLVLDIKPAGWIQKRDRTNPLSHSFFALGCARAGLDIMEQAQSSHSPTIAEAYEALNGELTHCREQIYSALDQPSPTNSFTLRARAIDLAVRCAHGAVIVSRGAANFGTHPAQRVYREALAFTVFGQTSNVMEASLNHIIRASSHPGWVIRG